MRISTSVEDIDASQHGETAYYFEEGSISSRATALMAAAATSEPSAHAGRLERAPVGVSLSS